MSTQIEHLERRVAQLDAELSAVRTELRALRHPVAPPPPPWPVAAPVPSAPPAPPAPAVPPAAAPAPAPARVMAWVGGSALLVALILFLALAVSRGWIGEEARTSMAAAASLLLLAGGARAYERRGRTEAAVAAAAAGAAGGFATLAVATEVYGLVPAALGLPLGLAWGAAAAVLALRWRSTTMAALGIAGGLLSPVLAGADVEATETIALLAIGYAGAAAVSVALGWRWLALLAFVLVAPQWAWHAIDNDAITTVIAFAAIAAAGCRSPLLMALNAAAAAATGHAVLDDGVLWLAGLGAAHAAGGLLLLRRERASALTALGAGVVLADLAFAEAVSGLALPLVWAASATLFALLSRHERIAALGLGGHLALAIGHVLTHEAPFTGAGAGSAAGVTATLAIAASCFVSARLDDARRRRLLDGLGLLALAYATTLALDGAPLVAALAAEAAALAALARRGEPDAEPAALGFLLYAAAAAVVVAPPAALAGGLEDPAAAAFALVPLAAAAYAVTRDWAASALTSLYLASVLLVTAVEGQPGQLTLSALWAGAGLAALLPGVLRDDARLRAGGLTLLAVATAKVFVVDLASLDSLTRVGSFLVLGTLLLAGAFAWQKARPS